MSPTCAGFSSTRWGWIINKYECSRRSDRDGHISNVRIQVLNPGDYGFVVREGDPPWKCEWLPPNSGLPSPPEFTSSAHRLRYTRLKARLIDNIFFSFSKIYLCTDLFLWTILWKIYWFFSIEYLWFSLYSNLFSVTWLNILFIYIPCWGFGNNSFMLRIVFVLRFQVMSE